jgi:uncharacterized membrane protein YsdA (DUF1294 family)
MLGGDRVFVHIKAFADRMRRPVVDDIVTYSVSADARGRPRAEEVAIAGVVRTAQPRQQFGDLPHVIALGFLLFVAGAVFVSAIPIAILVLYAVASSATFAAYALDKMAAKNGNWRTSESTLHLFSLVGGWPGALIAQSRLRHKTRKQPFRAVFWATVLMNCAAFVWLFTPEGAKAWQSIVSAA